MDPIVVDANFLIWIGAAVLSLGFSYIPKLNTWYAAKSEEFKKLFMALLVLALLVILFLLTCFALIQTNLVCTQQGIFDALVIYIFALAVNQGVYKISPQTRMVRAAKLPPIVEAKKKVPAPLK